MIITGSTALVTGSNRGLGREFARQLRDRGATVYAAARRPESVDLPGVHSVRLDVTDPASVEAAAGVARDVTLLVNNAGISTMTPLITGDLATIRAEMETHFLGTLAVTRAFASALMAGAARGAGAGIVNVMSLLSFRTFPGNGAYAAAKAAEWQLTNATRLELADAGVQVLGAHLSSTDTEMMAGRDIPKNDPADAVRTILDALEAGDDEVLVDDDTRAVKAMLAEPPAVLYAPFLGASRVG